MELLRTENLKKVYNTKLGVAQCVAINGVGFEVSEGEFVAIMGPSGSGKTTLLNMIASLDKPTSGDIYLAGKSFKDIKDKELSAFRRDNLGFIFQDFNLLDTFSIKDNILLPLVLARTPVAEMEARLAPIVQMLGVSHLIDKFPYEASGGERQRVAVARAIITNPKLILADEPTGALDSKVSANLLGILNRINEDGRTILMVTHSALAAGYASRVMFIQDGRLISQIYRGNDDRRSFSARIMAGLSAITDGGEQIG